MATFSKLHSGEWGVRVEGAKPNPGDQVEVERKDGGKVPKTISAVIWTQGQVHLCSVQDTGYAKAAKAPKAALAPAAPKAKRARKTAAAPRATKVRSLAYDPSCSACRAKDDVCAGCAFDEFDC